MQKPYLIKVYTISILVVLLLTSILLIPTFYDTYFSSKTAIGMTLLNAEIGGKTDAEISKLLDDEIAKPKNIKIQIKDKSIEIDLNSAGFMIDKEKTLKKVLRSGKKNFFEALKIKFSNAKIPVEIKTDISEFNQVIDQLLAKEGFSGKSFEVELLNNKAQIKINPNIRKANKEKLFNELSNSYNQLKEVYIIELDSPELPTALSIKKEIDIPVIDAKMEKNNDTTKVTPHQTGIEVDEQEIQAKLSNNELNFSVQIKILKPKVYTEDLGDSAFPTLLYKFSTNYNKGEISRSQNVMLATKKVNGTILNAGDIFSFNKIVGKRSYENGFQDAKIFLANKVIDDVGGGICQVSSTIYPAVLYSDLKIVERRNHNFVVSYAKPGFDATVVYGAIDFKFQNSFKNPIKIKATAVDGVMTVSIFGTKENNTTVELSANTISQTENQTEYTLNSALKKGETKVKQKGSKGMKVNSFRIVKDSSGTVIRTDNLGVSNYVPLVKIIETSDSKLTTPIEKPAAQEEKPSATPSTAPTNEPIATVSPEPTQAPKPSETPVPTIQPTPTITPNPVQTDTPIKN